MVTEQGEFPVTKRGKESLTAALELSAQHCYRRLPIRLFRHAFCGNQEMLTRRKTPLLCLFLVALLAGCSSTLERVGLGGGGGSASSSGGSDDQIELRKYYGTGYCPVIEVRDGTQAIRKYVKPREPSADTIVWQASIGETARQCVEDPNGTMTIKIGVSGRVLAGPKGGPADVTIPLRIAVVKYKEAVLSSELHRETVTIGADLSTVFRRVYEVTVPSPGEERNYLIYIGFDESK
jgi:hypothetical protein